MGAALEAHGGLRHEIGLHGLEVDVRVAASEVEAALHGAALDVDGDVGVFRQRRVGRRAVAHLIAYEAVAGR